MAEERVEPKQLISVNINLDFTMTFSPFLSAGKGLNEAVIRSVCGKK